VQSDHRNAIERKIRLTRSDPLPLIPAPNRVTGSWTVFDAKESHHGWRYGPAVVA